LGQIQFENSEVDLVICRTFGATAIPARLAKIVQRYQHERVNAGVFQTVDLQKSTVTDLSINIGNLALETENLSNEERLELFKSINELEAHQSAALSSGTIGWQFSGLNQFKHVTIRIKEKMWQVEFRRLQEPGRQIPLMDDSRVSLVESHESVTNELENALSPLDRTELTSTVILQGAPGTGKTHCAARYVYHHTNQIHQMVAWLSGESKDIFLKEKSALAKQLRYLEVERSQSLSDDDLISQWCENKLGQWLFVIDDVQVDFDWLIEQCPKRGGHLLITTSKLAYTLPPKAKVLTFSALSPEESKHFLNKMMGEYWEASGYQEEDKALDYLSQALGGSPALLMQVALLARKKSINFLRIAQQFQHPMVCQHLLQDDIFGQLVGQTFAEKVQKGWQITLNAMELSYPQLSSSEHLCHLNQFVSVLTHEIGELAQFAETKIADCFIIEYWQALWLSWGMEPIATEKLRQILSSLPLRLDQSNDDWSLSMAGLQALNLCSGKVFHQTFEPVDTALLNQPGAIPDIPANVHLSAKLDNSTIGHMNISLFNARSLEELKTWCLPTVNPYFIPRPQLTADIKRALPEKGKDQKSAELILAAASGMGGIGKTELARHFITSTELSGHYQRRFWFNADSVTALEQEFSFLAQSLGLININEQINNVELIRRIHRWLNIQSRWLVVFDNADNYNDIVEWIPKEGGSVLITTREPKPGTLTDKQIVRVQLLEAQEAVKWLFQLAKRPLQTASKTEIEAAEGLVMQLGFLPLAIAQAAAYLRENSNVTIANYQTNFKQHLESPELALKSNAEKNTSNYARKIVGATWQISLTAIEQNYARKKQSNLSSALLEACAYLAPKEIPVGLLGQWLIRFRGKSNTDLLSIHYDLDEYIGQLLRYSLLQRNRVTEKISLHRLLQESIRQLMEQKNEQKHQNFNKILGALFNYSYSLKYDDKDVKEKIMLTPHMQSVRLYSRSIDCKKELLLGILNELREALSLRRNKKDDSNHSILLIKEIIDLENNSDFYISIEDKVQSYFELSDEHYMLGNHTKAIEILLRTKDMIYSHVDDNSNKLLMRLCFYLSRAYCSIENKDECKTYLPLADGFYGIYSSTLEIKERKLFLNISCEVHDFLGARLLYEEKKEEFNNLIIPNEFSAVGASSNMEAATRLAREGKHSEAISLFESTLTRYRQMFGEKNIRMAIPLANMAVSYSGMQMHEKSKNLLLEAFQIKVENQGANSVETINTAIRLAQSFYNLANFDNKYYKDISCLIYSLCFFEYCFLDLKNKKSGKYENSKNKLADYKKNVPQCLEFFYKVEGRDISKVFLKLSRKKKITLCLRLKLFGLVMGPLLGIL